MKNMRKLPENLAQGRAGEYTVAAQLLLRGHNPYFPAVDVGADVMLNSGVKIQVKSTHLTFKKNSYAQGAYWFKLATRAIVRGRRIITTGPRTFSDECDFVILWGIEQNRFWIVPANVFNGHVMVVVGPDSSWVEADVEKLRIARESGMTYRDIAKDSGLSLGTVFRTAARGREPGEKMSLTREIRSYEGRWELIDEYIKTMDATDGVVENSAVETE